VSITGPIDAMFDTAVRNMVNAGVTVVVAAGNDGGDACSFSPSHVAEAITVGASDINDARAIYDAGASSNIGTCVDLFAPGKAVNDFGGTSAAAPHVAGAAALYLQGAPTATPAAVASYILSNATSSRLTGIGGSPNRLLFVPPGGTETDAKPTAAFVCGCSGTKTCTFTGQSTDDWALKSCRYTVGYDSLNRPIYRFGCGTVSYTYGYTGPYPVDLVVTDDGNQTSTTVSRSCQ
jgi:dihydroxyacetone kinase DhaKLM complex PTS-EIIA-like component DhaM